MRSRSVAPAGDGEAEGDGDAEGVCVAIELDGLGSDERIAAAQAAATTETRPRNPPIRKRRRDSIGPDGRAPGGAVGCGGLRSRSSLDVTRQRTWAGRSERSFDPKECS